MDLSLPTLIAAVLGSSGLTALILWLRFRKVDSATANKLTAEAQAAMHTSDANALSISSNLLAVWIKTASDSEKELIHLRSQLSNCICKRSGNGK